MLLQLWYSSNMSNNKIHELRPRSSVAGLAESERTIPQSKAKGASWKRRFLKAAAPLTLGLTLSFNPLSVFEDSSDTSVEASLPHSPRHEAMSLIKGEVLTTSAKEVYEKYGVYLISLKTADDAMEKLGINFPDSPDDLDWTPEEVKIVGKVLGNLPPSLTGPINGEPLVIFKGGPSLQETCKDCYGGYFHEAHFVGLSKIATDDLEKDNNMQLITHELTHRRDDLMGNPLWGRVNDLLQGSRFVNLPYYKNDPESQLAKLMDIGTFFDRKTAIATFGSFMSDDSFVEGIAGLSQLYVSGDWENFMRTVGPLTDGKGYRNIPKIKTNDLPNKYPVAAALYLVYQGNMFDGVQYSSQGLMIKDK